MKTLKQFSVFLLTVILFTGCFDDDGYSLDKYWVDIATVENPEKNNNFFFVLDDSTRLWTAASNFYDYRPKDGQRIIANYSILWDKRQTGLYDYDVKLNDAYEVLTKGIFNVTPATQDSIGSDSLLVKDIWIGSKYLNVEFVYQGFEKVHFINLVKDAAKTYTDSKVHLEFRHNANDDLSMYNRWGVVSFDISTLKTNTADSVQLVIHVNEPNKVEDKLYELTYHYKPTPSSVKRNLIRKSLPDESAVGKVR
jgi:hypothetical protein